MRGAHRVWPAVCLLWLLGGADTAGASERYWIFLPRAASPGEAVAFPSAPAPNERALQRRAQRGDPQRMRLLERAPQAALLKGLRERGIRIRYVSRWLSAASCVLDPVQRADLEQRLGAGRVRPVRRLRQDRPAEGGGGVWRGRPSKSAGAHDYGASQQQIEMIQADRLHALGLSGQGVRALVMDTGFFTELPVFDQLEIFAEHDFVFDDDETANEAPDSTAQHRHGTGVLALFAGYDPGQLIGAAYSAEVVLAKTEWVSGESHTEEDDFVAALEWGEALGVDLATASLGYCCFDDLTFYADEDYDGDTAPTTIAMDAAAAFGVLPLVAVGNRGNIAGRMMTPADADSVLSVGSVDADSTVSDFSSRGPTYDGRIKPELVALGRDAVWARPEGDYRMRSGTSTATPQVAAVAAMLFEAHPEWNPMQLREALLSSADQSTAPDNDRGYGLVRAHDALFALGDPLFPMPFRLCDPAEGDSVLSDPTPSFVWTRAHDYQDPAAVRYTLVFSQTEDFGEVFEFRDGVADSSARVAWLPAGLHYWRVLALDADGNRRASAARSVYVRAPSQQQLAGQQWARLAGPQPNPSRGFLRLDLRLKQPARAELSIYDLRGRRIRRLLGGRRLPTGLHLLEWDGRDNRGTAVANGSYRLLLELTAADGRESWIRRGILLNR